MKSLESIHEITRVRFLRLFLGKKVPFMPNSGKIDLLRKIAATVTFASQLIELGVATRRVSGRNSMVYGC